MDIRFLRSWLVAVLGLFAFATLSSCARSASDPAPSLASTLSASARDDVFTLSKRTSDDRGVSSTATFTTISNPGGAFRSASDGYDRDTGSGIVERWRRIDNGFEQSWVFGTKPTREAGQRLSIAVEHARRLEAKGKDVRIVLDDGSALLYRAAVLIDASGQRLPLRTFPEGSTIRIDVPAQALERAAYPVVIDPTVTPEEEATAPTPFRRYGSPMSRVIGFDGTNFVVAWSGNSDATSVRTLNVARVTPDGVVLDVGGVPIANVTFVDNLSGSCQGQRCLIAWAKSAYAPTQQSVMLLDSSAPSFAPTPISLPELSGSALIVAISSSPTEFLIAWRGSLASPPPVPQPTVNVRRLSLAGVPIDSVSTYVDQINAGWNVGLAYGAGTYLITTTDAVSTQPGTLRARTLASDLTLGPLFAIGTVSPQRDLLALAGSSSQFLALWSGTSGASNTIEGALVTPAGDATPLPTLRESPVGMTAATGATGSSFWVLSAAAGATSLPVQVRPVDGMGVLGTPVDFSDDDARPLNIACSDVGCLGGWGNSGMRGSIVGSASIANNQPHILSVGAVQELDVALGFTGSQYLAAWRERRASEFMIRAARFDLAGRSLDANGFTLSTPSPEVQWGTQSSQITITGGTDGALFSWVQRDPGPLPSLYARRMAPDGSTPIGPLLVSDDLEGSVLSDNRYSWFDQGAFRLVWPGASGPGLPGRNMQLLKPDGTLDGASFAPGVIDHPSVLAFAGHRVLVVGGATNGTLQGQISDNNGVAISAPFTIDPVPYQAMWATASGGDDHFLVLVSPGDTPYSIYSRRVSLDGVVGPKVPIADMGIEGPKLGFYFDAVVFDGADHLLFWKNQHDPVQLVGRRLERDGTFRGQPLVIDSDAARIARIRAVAGPEGSAMVGYVRWDANPGYGSDRVRTHVVWNERPLGRPCLGNASCESGICVDGVCCDDACGNGATDECVACSVATGAPSNGHCSMLDATHVCRAAAAACDAPEACTGAQAGCPADILAADGAPCSGGACTTGMCVPLPDLAGTGHDMAQPGTDGAVVNADMTSGAVLATDMSAGGTEGCQCEMGRRGAEPRSGPVALLVLVVVLGVRARRLPRGGAGRRTWE